MAWSPGAFCVLVGLISASLAPVDSAKSKEAPGNNCSTTPLQVVLVFDLAVNQSISDFRLEQARAVEAIRHTDAVAKPGQTAAYSFIVFHRLPVLLTPLNSPKSSDSSKVTEQLQNIRPRQTSDTSPAKALEMAADQIEKNGKKGARSVVFLVHSGVNNDLIAETLEAVQRLRHLNASIFTISGHRQQKPDTFALAGYSPARERIYASNSDRLPFFASVDEVLDTCLLVLSNVDPTPPLLPIEETTDCGKSTKVDLVVLLDTSGSLRGFEKERKLAIDIVKAMNSSRFVENVQFSLVSFSATPMILLALHHGRAPESVINRLQQVDFAGQNTRIAPAVDLALAELQTRRQKNSLPIFVIISDGHGQEYWSQAQAAGARLKHLGGVVFAATSLPDFNQAELALYAGRPEHVFVGQRAGSFASSLSALVNRCTAPPAAAVGHKLSINIPITGSLKPTAPDPVETSEESEDDFRTPEELKAAERRAENLRRLLQAEPGLSKSVDCDTDVLVIVDRTHRSAYDFNQQLAVVNKTLSVLTPADIASGKVRLSLIALARQPRVIVPLGSPETTLDAFSKQLVAILPTRLVASVADGLRALSAEISEHRRPSARAVILLVSSGYILPSLSLGLDETITGIASVPNSDVFALSLDPNANVTLLQSLTGDKWRVFVDARVGKYVKAVSTSLTSCSIPHAGLADGDPALKNVEFLVDVAQRLDKLSPSGCGPDPVDFVLLLDTTPDLSTFEAQKLVATNVIQQAAPGDFGRRIRISVVAFDESARLLVPLNSSVERDDLLFSLDRLEHTPGPTSVVAAISMALDEIKAHRRIGARVVLLILSNGNSRDGWVRIQKAGNALRKASIDVYAVAQGPERNVAELATYTDLKKRVFAGDKTELFVLSAQKVLFACSVEQRERHLADLTSNPKAGGVVVANAENDEPVAINVDERIPISLSVDKCLVDLVFIIDTSQSVVNEFQRQLQFAVDLVKRLPDDDFENRVNVAVVSFYATAKLEIPFGSIRAKADVLKSLYAIKHTGGSTSAVSGVDLAVREISRGRRPNARLMVVLVSDGNSQDPWENVVSAAERLRTVRADVYAVTVSHEYSFRELELYAGNKWFVYIDARIRQFLDEAEVSVVECRNPEVPSNELTGASTTTIRPLTKVEAISSTLRTIASSTTVATSLIASTTTPLPSKVSSACEQDLVDLLILLDTSTSVEKEFYAEKNFALDLIKVLPDADFNKRISVALVKFNAKANVQFTFGEKATRSDVLYEIERVEHTGGQTSLVAGVEKGLEVISSRRRRGSRLVTVIVSDGNSQDEWSKVQEVARKLRVTGSEIYAVTLSEKYYYDELKEYTGNERHVYIDQKIEQFLQEVGLSVVACPGRVVDRVTLAPLAQVFATPTTPIPKATTTVISTKPSKENNLISEALDDVSETRQQPLEKAVSKNRCKYSKMDIIIILDASTSRQQVFEHQRELALSLVERLPITKNSMQVASGINSFTSEPTLRQTLGLGRDKLEVRAAIEDIKYLGGSTLTSKAVRLAVKDLQRGRRPDALQVVVLMNDGMSQDPWDVVLAAAEELKNTGAERFGVALGDDVDLRELRHYIGNESRIYRDGSTEKFLSDIVSLLNGYETECNAPTDEGDGFEITSIDECMRPKLDIVIALDTVDNSSSPTEGSRIAADKYLILDLLGSLPANDDAKVAVIGFAADAKVIYTFADAQDRESLFKSIEGIQSAAPQEKPAYAKGVQAAADYYTAHARSDARGVLLLVGPGIGDSSPPSQATQIGTQVLKTQALQCHAIDAAKNIDERVLTKYTGDANRVYGYEKNAAFAKELTRIATAGQSEKCVGERDKARVRVEEVTDEEESFSQVQHDVASARGDEKSPFAVGGKLLIAPTPKPPPRRPVTTVTAPGTSPGVAPGCSVDLMLIMDCSGSVEAKFAREKELASDIVSRLRVGPHNARVAVVKFAAADKVRTVVPFDGLQSTETLLNAIRGLTFSSGTTAIHSALVHAATEFSPLKGARPGTATPIVVIFTDGFSQKDTQREAELLRRVAPDVYAIAVSDVGSRRELEHVTGDPSRVFTDSGIDRFYSQLDGQLRGC